MSEKPDDPYIRFLQRERCHKCRYGYEWCTGTDIELIEETSSTCKGCLLDLVRELRVLRDQIG